MANPLIRILVRTRLTLASRAQGVRQIERQRDRYLALAAGLDPAAGARPVRVPAMIGVDEDMRGWSFFQILEHNAIVNRSIASVVTSLVAGEAPRGPGAIDPKHGVMPADGAGPEQVTAFIASVDDYLASLTTLGRLRGTRRSQHPVFGSFDAHMWHGMLGFHLSLHVKQAREAIRLARANG